MQYGDISNFWFQPDRVEMKDANPYGHNRFLSKYWGEGSKVDTLPKENSYDLFNADNYYNADYGAYEKKVTDSGYSYDAVLKELQNKLGKNSDSLDTKKQEQSDYSAQDNNYVPNSQSAGIANQHAWLNSYTKSFEPSYNEYFDSIFN